MPYRPPSRLRRVVKWAGVGVCVLQVLIFLASLVWYAAWVQQSEATGMQHDVAFADGCVGYRRADPVYVNLGTPGLNVGRNDDVDFRWLPLKWGPILIVPLWIPFILTAIPTAILWRRDRRPPPGHCQTCGYNLTGNVSGKCPECFTEVEP